MPRFLYLGHNNLANRGSEALVRSTAGLLDQRLGQNQHVVPSINRFNDERQWRTFLEDGVEFVDPTPFPKRLGWWGRAHRVLPLLDRLGRPGGAVSTSFQVEIDNADAFVSSGGDVLSLDYGIPSLYYLAGVDEAAIRTGKPVILWAASVGPFARNAAVERAMRKLLLRYSALTVREASTLAYLERIGVPSTQVADPAFTMAPEPFDTSNLIPSGSEGVLGFNVSPLVRNYLATEAEREHFDSEIARFLTNVLNEGSLGITLLPHVDSLDGGSNNSDFVYMERLIERYDLKHSNLVIAPRTLNAPQLKYLLSKFKYFIGARTHATIGALSSGVPTLSLAYSVKAIGINEDLFGDDRYVLNSRSLTADMLARGLGLIREEEGRIKARLTEVLPVVRQRSAIPADIMAHLLGR